MLTPPSMTRAVAAQSDLTYTVSSCSSNQALEVNNDRTRRNPSSADSRKDIEQEAPSMDRVPHDEGRPSCGETRPVLEVSLEKEKGFGELQKLGS